MAAIAKKQGFAANTLLLTQQATVAAVSQAIQNAAKQLSKGDIFFLSYSGHGGQVPDTNRDEDDSKDETWVLYDRQFVDDELHKLYSAFKSGVRILVLSDSCHSGTVTRAIPPWEAVNPRSGPCPPRSVRQLIARTRRLYDGIQKATVGAESIALKATVLLISGCQDNQVSSWMAVATGYLPAR